MKPYEKSIGWLFFSTLGRYSTLPQVPALAIGQGVEAQRREPLPPKRQVTWGMGGISFLNEIGVDKFTPQLMQPPTVSPYPFDR